jgi:hypothetical protein
LAHVASMFFVHLSTLAHDTSIEFAQFRTARDASVASRHARTSSLSVSRHPSMNPIAVNANAPSVAANAAGGTKSATRATYASIVSIGARVVAGARDDALERARAITIARDAFARPGRGVARGTETRPVGGLDALAPPRATRVARARAQTATRIARSRSARARAVARGEAGARCFAAQVVINDKIFAERDRFHSRRLISSLELRRARVEANARAWVTRKFTSLRSRAR